MRIKRQAGFSLVELAVVVFIIGLIASMSFGAIKAQMINSSIRATKGNQDTIRDALVAYLGKYRRLPCPDTDFNGVENRTTPGDATTSCKASFGQVPYNDLGLPKTATLDGWDNFFSYQVSNSTAPLPNTDWTITNSFHEGNTGVITIKDGSGTDMLSIVAVVISYGKDGLGAYTIKGTPNTPPDLTTQPDQYQNSALARTGALPNVYYKREYSDNTTVTGGTGGTFDDVVMILGANDLLWPLIKDGAIKSPEAQWATQLYNIKTAIVTWMLSHTNCQTPASYSATDPWGGAVGYSSSFTGFNGARYSIYSASAASATYTLSVSNPAAVGTLSGPSLLDAFGNPSTWQSTCN